MPPCYKHVAPLGLKAGAPTCRPAINWSEKQSRLPAFSLSHLLTFPPSHFPIFPSLILNRSYALQFVVARLSR